MLQSLHVKNIALIDDVEINFSDGLNILSGETGAGKSIIIDAVNFALGGRINKDVVRDESSYALSELVFYVDDEKTLSALKQMDIVVDDNEVILQRRISNGKTSCKCNGESIPANMVKTIAELLIDIHGQHEHQSLSDKKKHIEILDGFCGDEFEKKLSALKDAYSAYKKIEREYEEAGRTDSNRQQDMDYSEFVVSEIEAADLKIGEDEELEREFSRMNNSRRISEEVQAVRNAMSSDGEGVGNLLSYAVSAMRQVAALDPDANELYEQLKDTEGLVQDFNRGLYDYEDTLEFSMEEFAQVEERLNEINRLKMKYGQTIEKILEHAREESLKIEKLADYDKYLNDLLCKKQEYYAILCRMCQEVSEIRTAEAKILQDEIVRALNNLNFLDARFEILVTANEDKITSLGYDDVEFMISTNPGEDLKKLTQVASGGELSRIMLALKSLLAKRDSIGTMIFDEIDTGISGKTAQRVADRMSEIAAQHQVICITHLPQIASHANSHYLIQKSVEANHTSTSVLKLTYEESIEELARMLSGEAITDAVRENAAEMKRAALGLE